jgi:hypothetical protein
LVTIGIRIGYGWNKKGKNLIKDRSAILDRFLSLYQSSYDILNGDMASGLPLMAVCQHHTRSEKFVLSRKARLWAVEVNDYLYLFSMPRLEKEQAQACISFSIEDALPRVKPHKEHMYSFITTVFVADEADKDALKFIRRRRFNKSYKLGIYGASPLKTAVLNIEQEKVETNNMGRDLRRQINNICEKGVKS